MSVRNCAYLLHYIPNHFNHIINVTLINPIVSYQDRRDCYGYHIDILPDRDQMANLTGETSYRGDLTP